LEPWQVGSKTVKVGTRKDPREPANVAFHREVLGRETNVVGIQSAKLGFQSTTVGFLSAACLFRLAAPGCREIMGNLQSFVAGRRATTVGILSMLVGSTSESLGRLEAVVGNGAFVRGLETTKRTRIVPEASRRLAMSERQSFLIQRRRHSDASSKTPHGDAIPDLLHL
jgi:hypothetical protein